MDEIADSLCVGQKINEGGDERVVLFLKMASGHVFGEPLVRQVKAAIRKELSARHVPAIILEITDIPVSASKLIW
jgi:acetoacetyl-CoA synthetase